MAIALVASTNVPNGTGGTSGNIDTTGATLLTIGVGYWPTRGAFSDSKGNVWVSRCTANQFWFNEILDVVTPTVGSGHNFTLPSATFSHAGIGAWSGTDSGAYDKFSTGVGGGGTTVQPGSVTPTVAASLVVSDCTMNSGAGAPSVNSGFSSIYSSDGTAAGGGSSNSTYLVPDTAAVNPTYTITATGNSCACIVVYKPASAAAGGGPIVRGGSIMHGAIILGGRIAA